MGCRVGFEHLFSKFTDLFLHCIQKRPEKKDFILAGGHVRASAGALAVHTALILAGGHVRASAGALAVHTALILAGGHVREAPWT